MPTGNAPAGNWLGLMSVKYGPLSGPKLFSTDWILAFEYKSTSASLEFFWELELLPLPKRTRRSPGLQALVVVVATAVSSRTLTPLAPPKLASISNGVEAYPVAWVELAGSTHTADEVLSFCFEVTMYRLPAASTDRPSGCAGPLPEVV